MLALIPRVLTSFKNSKPLTLQLLFIPKIFQFTLKLLYAAWISYLPVEFSLKSSYWTFPVSPQTGWYLG